MSRLRFVLLALRLAVAADEELSGPELEGLHQIIDDEVLENVSKPEKISEVM